MIHAENTIIQPATSQEPWETPNWNGIVNHDNDCYFQSNEWDFGRLSDATPRNFIRFELSGLIEQDAWSTKNCSDLLWTLKCYALARLRPRNRCGSGAPGTVAREFDELISIVKWMISKHDSVTFSIFNNEEIVAEWVDHARETAVSPHNLTRLLAPLVSLFDERSRMPEHQRVTKHPYNGAKLNAIARYDAFQHSKPIPCIPDEIAIPLLSECRKWIVEYADEIINLLTKKHEAEVRLSQLNLSPLGLQNRLRRELWNRGDVEVADQYVRPFEIAGRTIKGLNDIDLLETDLKFSCLVTIGCFAGPRISEILSLASGCIIGPERSADGTIEIYWLQGNIFKNAPGIERSNHKWVAGARITGTNDPVPVVEAVKILERLKEAIPSAKTTTLFFGRVSRETLTTDAVSNIMKLSLSRLLKGTPMREWSFSTHQFRKTFSRFVAQRHRHGFNLVAQQLGHTHIATAMGYAGTDSDLNILLRDEIAAETAREIFEVASTNIMTGGKGDAIRRPLQNFRGLFASETEFIELVSKAVANEHLKVFPSEWGICFYHQRDSKCGGGISTPNHAIRNPAVCGSCKNLVITEIHRPYHEWRVKEFSRVIETHPNAPVILSDEWKLKRDESQKHLDQLNHLKAHPDT